MATFATVPGVATVEVLRGAEADADAPFDLLLEVPHGADERSHYDALRTRLEGPLPADLHLFFFANTDLGAWAYGRRTVERLLERDPTRSALLVRCLLPRTFVDTNRLPEAEDRLAEGGLTGALPAYITADADRRLLRALHASYVSLVERAYEAVCGAGGFALTPHSYGPRTMGIPRVEVDIVERLRAAWEPAAWAGWPLRPEIDLISKTPDGTRLADAALCARVLAALRAAGFEVVDGGTYVLHPATQGARLSARYPGRTLCLEVRRDLLVERFDLLAPLTPDPERVDRVALPLAEALDPSISPRRA